MSYVGPGKCLACSGPVWPIWRTDIGAYAAWTCPECGTLTTVETTDPTPGRTTVTETTTIDTDLVRPAAPEQAPVRAPDVTPDTGIDPDAALSTRAADHWTYAFYGAGALSA